jgi:2-haloacid dehalogenase
LVYWLLGKIFLSTWRTVVTVDRRQFLTLATASALLQTPSGRAAALNSYKAIAFDGLALFDPRPVALLAEKLFPGNGQALMNVWRLRQFDYQWLRALSARYANFLQATEESLAFAAKQLKVTLSADQRQQLMSVWTNLEVWPDVSEAISVLREADMRLTILSNMTAHVLNAGLERANLRHAFESVVSTDQIQSYKPDPRAYQLSVSTLQLRREEILFVAFAGWDVAGAKWFGYPTFWANRLGSPMEELGVEADASGPDLNAVVRFALGHRGN